MLQPPRSAARTYYNDALKEVSNPYIGLASPVRTEKTGHLAGQDGEGQLVDGEFAPVSLGQPAQLELWHGVPVSVSNRS